MRNSGSKKAILIYKLLLNGRLPSPGLDITKLSRMGGGGVRGIPKMLVVSFTKGVEAVYGSWGVERNFNQTGGFLEQGEGSTPMPRQGSLLINTYFKKYFSHKNPKVAKRLVIFR